MDIKVIVELVFDDKTLNRNVEVTVKKGATMQTTLNRIDKAVEKQFKDEPWVRWNLVDLAQD